MTTHLSTCLGESSAAWGRTWVWQLQPLRMPARDIASEGCLNTRLLFYTSLAPAEQPDPAPFLLGPPPGAETSGAAGWTTKGARRRLSAFPV